MDCSLSTCGCAGVPLLYLTAPDFMFLIRITFTTRMCVQFAELDPLQSVLQVWPQAPVAVLRIRTHPPSTHE